METPAKTLEQALKEFNSTLSFHGFDELATVQEEQRTPEWFAERLGMFSGSKFSDLMTCQSKAKGRDYSTHLWLFDFGDTALNYILERAIERATGNNLETVSTWQMRWGTEHEAEGKSYVEDQLKATIQEFGFVKFLKNAGCSPDGKLKIATMDLAFEIKCPATTLSHYKLMHKTFDENHEYFWQVTGEMLALKVENALFCTYDPRYPEYAKLGKKQVHLSNLHARALKFRIIVAEKLVNRLLESEFTCDLRDELAVIKADCPADFDGLVEWYLKELKPLEL